MASVESREDQLKMGVQIAHESVDRARVPAISAMATNHWAGAIP